MKVAQQSKHIIFTGPPGTGKTTIARVVANILAGLGVIAEPKLVETSRKDFVAEYEGQSSVKTARTIDRAVGGVLFIDEAYTLVQERDGRADPFGTEALDTLLARMENDRDRLVVIIAGYSADIDRLLESNDGLRSRFSNRIEFDSYLPSEIVEITKVLATANDSTLSEEAAKRVLEAATLLIQRSLERQAGARHRGQRPLRAPAGRGRRATPRHAPVAVDGLREPRRRGTQRDQRRRHGCGDRRRPRTTEHRRLTMAGFRLTTKVQVSGWRFLLRRVEHAIVRRDTRMFDDPLQFYSRAVAVGIVVAVLICLGAALLAYFKPLGKRGGDSLLVDRTTNQLYVVMPGMGQLRPVYNLTSARLVLGNPGTPSAVKSDELNRMSKGQPIGIPGAPYATPVSTVAESTWTLCDTVTKPESVAPTVETSVIVLPLVTDGSVGPMRPDQGLLVSFKGKDWLVTENGRHAIDLSDRAVTSAVGIPVTAKSTPISEGLFNALPNAGPWQLPQSPPWARRIPSDCHRIW